MKVQAVIPTAGVGARLKSDQPKPFVLLQDKPLFAYCYQKFQTNMLIDSIIAVVNKDSLEEFETHFRENNFSKVIKVVPGGETRSESVGCGVKELDEDTDYVIIHDAARPFVTDKMITETLEAAFKDTAATTAVPVKPTIKEVNKQGYVEQTLDRDILWETQTPQAFAKDIIVEAHTKKQDQRSTDDASLVEQMGSKVKVVEGSYTNIKITTIEDLELAELLLSKAAV